MASGQFHLDVRVRTSHYNDVVELIIVITREFLPCVSVLHLSIRRSELSKVPFRRRGQRHVGVCGLSRVFECKRAAVRSSVRFGAACGGVAQCAEPELVVFAGEEARAGASSSMG